jgi:hypothetical protein
VFNVIGILLGIVLSPRRSQPANAKEDSCCSLDKSVGSHFLMASAALTFAFYWLYILLVCVLFLAGGGSQTEVCRHAINYENEKSADVLAIFDRWINESLYNSTGIEIELSKVYM